MFLFVIPMTVDAVPVHNAAPIDRTIPAVIVPVNTPMVSDNGVTEIAPGVTLTMADGFTVTMDQKSAETALAPPTETDAEYQSRLCLQLVEAKPWLGIDCNDYK